MESELYRKKSLDRISSPEQLDDYIRVTNPGVWFVLGAVVILLIGACLWGVFGQLDTTVKVEAVAQGGKAILYLTEDTVKTVAPGDKIRANDKVGTIQEISPTPISYRDACAALGQYEYVISANESGKEALFFAVTADIPGIAEGVTKAEIIIESAKPISFVLN
ncbi:MAG: hypothetical protein RSC76_05450 [Oscillospiraceae bacterium]